MAYKIIDIEGVGDVYAEKLQAAGIKTVDDLLDRCADPKGRKELEEATEISGKLILKWTCSASRVWVLSSQSCSKPLVLTP